MKKLTKAQQRAWEKIKAVYLDRNRVRASGEIDYSDFGITSDERMYPRYGARIQFTTLTALAKAGLIRLIPSSLNNYFTLTDAGKAEIAPEAGSVEAVFGVGDKVIFRDTVAFFSNDLRRVQEARTAMTVNAVDDIAGVQLVSVTVPDFGKLWFNAVELELWKPPAPEADWSAIAAATLDSLKSDDELRADYDALKQENARLKAVLVPFATIGAILRTMPNPYTAWSGYISGRSENITLSDLYAADRALNGEPEPER